MKKPEKKTYADTKNPLISAALNGLYSFLNKEDAAKVLQQIRDKFILSKVLVVESEIPNHLILWVKSYSITKQEKKDGYKGNYALIHIDSAQGKKFTLKAQKIDSELKFHPEKKYQKQQHPNWGFPILRRIKKKTEYDTLEAATNELISLQEQFPLVTIPGKDKLFAMIYEKIDGKNKVNKYVLEAKALENGKFTIIFYLNEDKKKKKNNNKPIVKGGKRGADGRVEGEFGEKIGTFTTKVVVRREMKKKKLR